jgi:hypothetical protein
MPAPLARTPRQRGVARPSLGGLFGRAHHSDLVDLATAIIGDPLANLGSMVEVARSHPRAIEAKPFPIPVGRAVSHIALSMNGAVFVVFDVSFPHVLKNSIPPTRSPVARQFGAATRDGQDKTMTLDASIRLTLFRSVSQLCWQGVKKANNHERAKCCKSVFSMRQRGASGGI